MKDPLMSIDSSRTKVPQFLFVKLKSNPTSIQLFKDKSELFIKAIKA